MVAHLRLGHAAERKDDARQALAIEVVEHVGLVLGRVDPRVQLAAVEDARVVAGCKAVEAQRQHPRQHQVEADEGVAAHAGVGRPAFEVGAVERLDHPLAELFLQVPAVIRNVEQARDPSGVLHGRQRAAPAVPRRLRGVVARPLLQRHADDVVAPRL